MAAIHSIIKRIKHGLEKLTKIFADYNYLHSSEKQVVHNPERVLVKVCFGKDTIDTIWKYTIVNNNHTERKLREFERDIDIVYDIIKNPSDFSESSESELADTSSEQIA